MVIVSPRATATAYDVLPIDFDQGDLQEQLRKVTLAVNNIMDGKINATGSVTLNASVAATTLSDTRIALNSCLHFMPTTANAAAEQGAGTLYVSSRDKQKAVITHANNAQADRTYCYSVLGG